MLNALLNDVPVVATISRGRLIFSPDVHCAEGSIFRNKNYSNLQVLVLKLLPPTPKNSVIKYLSRLDCIRFQLG